MTKNESAIDRWIRLIIAVVLFFTALYWTSGILQIILYIIAATLLITAITGFCLLYKWFGINTAKKPADKIE